MVFGPEAQAAINKIAVDWGIEVMPDSVIILDVGLMDEDQAAFAAKKRQKLQTAANAQEILGGMLETVALSIGVADGDEARVRLSQTQEGKEYLQRLVAKANLIVGQKVLGVRPQLFGNADGTSLEPVTATLASLITLARGTGDSSGNSGQQGNRGRNPGVAGGGAGDGDADGQGPPKTYEELAQEFADDNGGLYPRWDPLGREPHYNG